MNNLTPKEILKQALTNTVSNAPYDMRSNAVGKGTPLQSLGFNWAQPTPKGFLKNKLIPETKRVISNFKEIGRGLKRFYFNQDELGEAYDRARARRNYELDMENHANYGTPIKSPYITE